MPPSQRKPGGRGGDSGHRQSQSVSRTGRGGSPGAGGAGFGKTPKPPKKGGTGSIFLAPWIDIPLTLGVFGLAMWKGIQG